MSLHRIHISLRLSLQGSKGGVRKQRRKSPCRHSHVLGVLRYFKEGYPPKGDGRIPEKEPLVEIPPSHPFIVTVS